MYSYSLAVNEVRTQQFLRQVGLWMVAGIGITTMVAFILTQQSGLMNLFFSFKNGHQTMSTLGWIVMFAPLAAVFGMGFFMQKASKAAMVGMYVFITACFGVTMVPIAFLYTPQSILLTLAATMGSFGGFAAWGFLTKHNLAGIGHFVFMALWGLIILNIAYMFFPSAHFNFLLGAGGVIIFTLMTAYDVQRLKDMSESVTDDKMAIWGALSLYLDFVNLFMSLLQLLGNRN